MTANEIIGWVIAAVGFAAAGAMIRANRNEQRRDDEFFERLRTRQKNRTDG